MIAWYLSVIRYPYSYHSRVHAHAQQPGGARKSCLALVSLYFFLNAKSDVSCETALMP